MQRAGRVRWRPMVAVSTETRWLTALVVACSIALWATSIPESFTVDDCNYLATVQALRDGSLFVPGTGQLMPSRELVGFDPVAHLRLLEAGKIGSTAPPLYAPWALPLSYLGWRWLILLNVLAFAATTTLVFRLTKRYADHAPTRWLAAGLFVLGGFSLDYAQGLWPHMLSVALTTSGVWFSCRARDENRALLAAVAGVCVGMAAGIRYQNVVFAFGVGLTLLLWAKRRWRVSSAYTAGIAIPMAATTLINGARLGIYNPISKGAWYLPKAPGRDAGTSLLDMVATLWVRVVDYSAHPPFQGAHGQATLPKDPTTGVFFIIGGLKKALLQSAPWIALALLAFVLVWSTRLALTPQKRRTIQALAIPVFVTLALFSWAGLERHDGWSFNQRYLLELVPLFAVTVALLVDTWEFEPQGMVIGGAIGMSLAAVPVVAAIPEHVFRQRALMFVPLVIAGALLIAACHNRGKRVRMGLLATAVGWAFVVHLGDDMQAARGLRDHNGFQRRSVAQHLPNAPIAIVAMAPQKEAMCPFHLEHDLVMVDPVADGAEDLHDLTGELLAAGRRVFVMGGLPQPWLAAIFQGRQVKMLSVRPLPFAEVLAAPAATTEEAGDAPSQPRKSVE